MPGSLCPSRLLWLGARSKGPCRVSSRPAEEPPSGGARDSEAPSTAVSGRGALCLTRRFVHLFIFLGRSTVWPCMAPLPLTFPHLKNLLYLFSDLIRNYFYKARPLKPLYLLVNPAAVRLPYLKGNVLSLPAFPTMWLILCVNAAVGVFLWKLKLKSVDPELDRLASILWMGLIRLGEVL